MLCVVLMLKILINQECVVALRKGFLFVFFVRIHNIVSDVTGMYTLLCRVCRSLHSVSLQTLIVFDFDTLHENEPYQ